jgi:predicted RNA binding protein YcfA (HicA-like mRNA interferase family)
MKSSELVRLLKKDGWYTVRQTGSHMIMEHPVKKGQIVCPYHGSHEVGKGLEKKIKKDAGIK